MITPECLRASNSATIHLHQSGGSGFNFCIRRTCGGTSISKVKPLTRPTSCYLQARYVSPHSSRSLLSLGQNCCGASGNSISLNLIYLSCHCKGERPSSHSPHSRKASSTVDCFYSVPSKAVHISLSERIPPALAALR